MNALNVNIKQWYIYTVNSIGQRSAEVEIVKIIIEMWREVMVIEKRVIEHTNTRHLMWLHAMICDFPAYSTGKCARNPPKYRFVISVLTVIRSNRVRGPETEWKISKIKIYLRSRNVFSGTSFIFTLWLCVYYKYFPSSAREMCVRALHNTASASDSSVDFTVFSKHSATDTVVTRVCCVHPTNGISLQRARERER